MKILIISNIFPPGFIGGYELSAFEIAMALHKEGNQIRVLTSDFFLDDNKIIKEFNVDRHLECYVLNPYYNDQQKLEKSQFFNHRNIRFLNKVIIDFSPEVVICFNLLGLGVLGILRHLVGIGISPILYLGDHLFHSLRSPQIYKKYLSIFGPLNFLHQIKMISVSRVLANEIQNTLGFNLDDLHIIPAWSQKNFLKKDENINFARFSSSQPTRFIFASRIGEHKGIYIIIQAIKHLVLQGQSNFLVDIYGAGEVTQIVHLIAAENLSKIIRYCGQPPKEEMCNIFKNYDALLFPTWEREPFALVVPEAAASGCIPIMTSAIGASEWFINDFDCIKIERNFLSLANAILDFMQKPQEEKKQMSLRGKHTALYCLDFDKQVALIYKLIKEVAKKYTVNLKQNKGCEVAISFLEDTWRNI